MPKTCNTHFELSSIYIDHTITYPEIKYIYTFFVRNQHRSIMSRSTTFPWWGEKNFIYASHPEKKMLIPIHICACHNVLTGTYCPILEGSHTKIEPLAIENPRNSFVKIIEAKFGNCNWSIERSFNMFSIKKKVRRRSHTLHKDSCVFSCRQKKAHYVALNIQVRSARPVRDSRPVSVPVSKASTQSTENWLLGMIFATEARLMLVWLTI